MLPVKSILHTVMIFGVRMNAIFITNIHKIRDIILIFTYFIAKTFTQTDRNNFNFLGGNSIENGTTVKTKIFERKENYESRNNHSKVTAEHAFKKMNKCILDSCNVFLFDVG